MLLISVSPICAAVERSNSEADQMGCRSNVKSQHDCGVLKTLGAMGPLRQVKLHQNSLYPGDLCCLVVVDYINPSRREVAGRLLDGDILYGLGSMI